MITTTADALVAGEPAEVYSAALALAAEFWAVDSDDILVSDAARHVMHAVRLAGETTCWLTWDFEQVGPRSTRVHLVHDELALDAAPPPPELDEVLALLRQRAAAPRRRTARIASTSE